MIRTAFQRTAPDARPKPPSGPRMRKCAVKTCRKPFAPRNMTHKACSPECAVAVALAARQAAERKADKVRKVALMTRADHAVPAQRAVNRYVSLRDREKPCISCGKPAAAGGVRNASHFKSVGSNSALRFHLWNIHTSCYRCNVELSGNLGEYYPRLAERIGIEKVEFLQNAKRERRYEIDELQRIARIFTKKAKRLERSTKC